MKRSHLDVWSAGEAESFSVCCLIVVAEMVGLGSSPSSLALRRLVALGAMQGCSGIRGDGAPCGQGYSVCHAAESSHFSDCSSRRGSD